MVLAIDRNLTRFRVSQTPATPTETTAMVSGIHLIVSSEVRPKSKMSVYTVFVA